LRQAFTRVVRSRNGSSQWNIGSILWCARLSEKAAAKSCRKNRKKEVSHKREIRFVSDEQKFV
jgi:hypothetical protein